MSSKSPHSSKKGASKFAILREKANKTVTAAVLNSEYDDCSFGKVIKHLGNSRVLVAGIDKKEYQAVIRTILRKKSTTPIYAGDVVIISSRDFESRAGTADARFDIMAVKVSGFIISDIKEQTPEICLEAVKRNGYALSDVRIQTPEICMAAVKQNSGALEYVKEQTPEICLAAVKRGGCAIRYVKEQTPELCLEAVKQTYYALKYIKKQTPELCLEAVKQNKEALYFISDKNIRDSLMSTN